MRQVALTLGCTFVLAACGGDEAATPSAVARSFDELSKAIANCAGMLRGCNEEDAGAMECRDAFFACRDRAGESAQEGLAEAVSECQARARACRDDAGPDAGADECAGELRACIGEARAQSGSGDGRAGNGPNPNASTYQCFGQLRECIAGGTGPNQCAAEARACVIAAIGEPPRGRPQSMQPSDAGMTDRDADRPDPRAGAGGATAGQSGASGAAGKPSMPGKPPAAGQPAAGAGGATAEPDPGNCAGAYEACLMSDEKPMKCERELRKCVQEQAKP